MVSLIRARWHAEGGYREFLGIALPLVVSSASWSLQHFVDRVFLTWYSTEALAAANPGGLTNFVILSLFLGLAQYVNTFVAQYMGARRPERVGAAVWQGVHVAGVCGLLALIPAAFAVELFDFIGHDPSIRQAEADYFSVLCYGIGFHVLGAALSCFFSGRSQTLTVMVVNVAANLLNILLDYVLIFGKWGFPEWGIRGAGWATNAAGLLGALLFLVLFLRPEHRRKFGTLSGWRPDPGLIERLLRYGGPSGLTFMLDILAFSIFILIAGRLGTIELAATNLAFHINGLAFMPLYGAGIAVSTMVGQRLGREQPEQAEYCAWTGFHLGASYMTAMALAYVLVPELFLKPFSSGSSDANFVRAYALSIPLLRIVAVYCVFDALYAIFTAALKGAGDTRFIMWASLGLGWGAMVIPIVIGQTYFGLDLFDIWAIVCVYICVTAVVFYLRFRGGRWKSMRVIEESQLEKASPVQDGTLTLDFLEPETSESDARIDQLRTQLGAPDNPNLFPPHFLKATFPKMGGRTALFSSDGETAAAGFLFPRPGAAGRRGYTLRLHAIGATTKVGATVTAELEEQALLATQRQWPETEIVPYLADRPPSWEEEQAAAPGLTIDRPGTDGAAQIRRMQQTIWDSEMDFLYPGDLHSAAFAAGSSLLARVDGVAAGFLFGFYSHRGPTLPADWSAGPLRIESQLLGVLPEFRGRNIASALKTAQAARALENGISVIHWTVDPLQYANARLNFGQLRAVAFTFHRDYYSFRNELNRTPASRLGITWPIGSKRVREALAEPGSKEGGARNADIGPDFPGGNWERLGLEADPAVARADGLAIEMPDNWTSMQREEPEQAAVWRAHTDDLFERLLGIEEGRYVITGVGTEGERNYLLARRVSARLTARLGGGDPEETP